MAGVEVGVTCCIGISTPGGILVAADTCVQAGEMIYERSEKIFSARRGLLATAGSSSAIDTVVSGWCAGDGSLESLVRLTRAHAAEKPDGLDGACYIWAGRHGLRSVDGYGCATRSQFPFVAIGTGEETAIGYMGGQPVAKTLEEAEKLARKTLKFVAQCVANVRPPFSVGVWPPARRR